ELSSQDGALVFADLRELLDDPQFGSSISEQDIADVAAQMPAVGRLIVDLHRRVSQPISAAGKSVLEPTEWSEADLPDEPFIGGRDRVDRFFAARLNYFDCLDVAAERLFLEACAQGGDLAEGLGRILAGRKPRGRPASTACERGLTRSQIIRRLVADLAES